MSEKVAAHEPAKPPKKHRARRVVGAALVAAGLSAASSAPAVAESTPSTTPVVEASIAKEKFARQQRAATVQLRILEGASPQGQNPADEKMHLSETSANCSATHIGKGWFVTAAHCFGGHFRVDSQLHDGFYDAIDTLERPYEAWKGVSPNSSFKEVGQVDSLIINGNFTDKDLALVHVKGYDGLPAASVTPKDEGIGPWVKDKFYVSGYPQVANFVQSQFEVSYIGRLSGEAFNDIYGLGKNLSPLYVFGLPKGTGFEKTVCTPGMSGGSVMDEHGKIWGVLSRYDKPGGAAWAAMDSGDFLEQSYDALCIFQPINDGLIDRLEDLRGVGPAPGSTIIYK